MKKVTFLKLLDLISNVGKDTEKLEELGIDVCESTLVNGMCELFDAVMEDAYGQEGLEWIQWWVYEKSRNPELKAFETDEHGNEVEIIRSADELYEYLEEYHMGLSRI